MQTYNGNEPYIFISYAHKDSATVLPLIEALQGRGFRVWYDAGIAAGTEWPEYIADRLSDSACVVVFISAAALASQNCRREINFAIDEKKEMLAVYLEDLELSRGMRMQLGVLQALYYSRFTSDAAFVAELCEAEVLKVCLDGSAVAADGAEQARRMAEAQLLYNEKKYAEALPLFEVLAHEGHAEASYYVGWMYYSGWGAPQDYAAAAQWFRKAADMGNVYAASDFGIMCQNGTGVPQDDEAAVWWFRRAAEGGNVAAWYLLGLVYQNGRGVPQDITHAVEWYRKAAAQGNEKARAALKELGY